MSDTLKHAFTSAKPDGLDATLVRPSNWNEEHKFAGGSDGDKLMRDSSQTDGASWVSGETLSLTNRVGEQLVAGDVATLDSANDASVAYDDTQASTRAFVVAQRTINNLAAGPFLKSGKATVLVTGDVTRGNWLRKSATNAALEDTGVAQSAEPPIGALAVALAAAVGPGTNLINVFLLGATYRQIHSRQVFTSTDSFTIPKGITEILVTLVGGGGGGGGGGGSDDAARLGGGGGSGGMAGSVLRQRLSVTPGDSHTVTIGAAGAAGPGGTGNPGANGGNGGAGGDTSFQGLDLAAKGGLGGLGGAAANGSSNAPGGAARTGRQWLGSEDSGKGGDSGAPSQAGSGDSTLYATGGSGGANSGVIRGGGGGGAGGSNTFGGKGGNGGNGGAGTNGSPIAGSPGIVATGFGGGGGGGGGVGGTDGGAGGTSGGAGAAGTAGVCIVEW